MTREARPEHRMASHARTPPLGVRACDVRGWPASPAHRQFLSPIIPQARRSYPMSAHDTRCECPTCRIQVAIELLETGRTTPALQVLRGASLRTWKTTKPKQPAKRSKLEERLTGGGGQLRDDDAPPGAA